MVKINPYYLDLPTTYLFSEVGRRAREYQASHPGVRLLRLGVGNTTEPLAPTAIAGLHRGVDRLADIATYTGYGDEQGDSRLRRRIAEVKYGGRGVEISPDEIFISDGAKPDTANIQTLFSRDAIVAVQDPAYPVYVDTNVTAGRAGKLLPSGLYERLVYMPCTADGDFFPALPDGPVDLIYLCSPNNPTGAVLSKEQLSRIVVFALERDAVILYDAAYECFIQDPVLPRSIYEVPDARRCAIELCTFSKEAGFTGVRLGWTVVPKGMAVDAKNGRSLNDLWNRRTTTFFNGASNVAQEGGLAALTPEGKAENRLVIDYYLGNAAIIREGLESLGLTVYGGTNAPYLWLRTPGGMPSWDFFEKMLDEAHVVSTPGVGFGPSGEGYMRLSSFGHRADVEAAVDSLRRNLRL